MNTVGLIFREMGVKILLEILKIKQKKRRNRMKKFIKLGIWIGLCFILLIGLTGCAKPQKEYSYRVVTSFYPMYVIALNLCDGIEDVQVQNMTDTAVGCLHDYTLKTKDLRKIEKANMFVMNGAGVENFMDKITQNRTDLAISDTSKADLYWIKDGDEINGHVWNNTNNYLKQIEQIKNDLVANDPAHREQYEANAEKYSDKIRDLEKQRYEVTKETYVVSCNEALAYLLDDVELKIVPVYTEHEESTLSGSALTDVIQQVKDKNIRAIFVDKNDNQTNAKLIAKETGAQIYTLDSGVTGDKKNKNDKDAYINTMKENYQLLKNIFQK